MRTTIAFGTGLLCTLLSCSKPVCEIDAAQEICDPIRNSLQVSCGPAGRIPLTGAASLLVPDLTLEGPQLVVSALRPDGMTGMLPNAAVREVGKVDLAAHSDELGTSAGRVSFSVTRGRWRGSSADGACRLFRPVALDTGRSNSYPHTAPYENQARKVDRALTVQIGPTRQERSVLVAEQWDSITPGRWIERYKLVADALAADPSFTDTVWKPLRSRYAEVVDDGIQTAVSKNGLLLYGTDLATISLAAQRTDGWRSQSVMIPTGAILAAAADQDWFLLASGAAVTAFRYDGSVVFKLGELPIPARSLAVRAARTEGNQEDQGRSFDALVLDQMDALHLLRLSGGQLSDTLPALSSSATEVLRTQRTGSAQPALLALGDLDSDGLQDLLFWDPTSQEIRWAAQSGPPQAAQFQPFAPTGISAAGVQSLAVGDVDSDSLLDIAVVAAGRVTVYLQR